MAQIAEEEVEAAAAQKKRTESSSQATEGETVVDDYDDYDNLVS
jgi:hypothetical protein